MPLAFDKDQIFKYVLSTDRAKAADKQPTLLFHFPTCRETRKIADAFDAAEEAKTVAESIKLRCDAMRIILCGWENFVDRYGKYRAYCPEDLDDLLTDADFTELKVRLLKDMSWAEIDKKKAVFSPPSATVPSVPVAPAVSATNTPSQP